MNAVSVGQELGSGASEDALGKRDRAILAILAYTSSRTGAISKLRRGDFYDAGDHQWMLRFEEKGGKSREIPVRHDLQQMIAAYIEAAGLQQVPKDASLFRAAIAKTGQLAATAIHVNDICRMMKRRLADASLAFAFFRRTRSVSPSSPTFSNRACRSKMCSTWPPTPTFALRGGSTITGRGRSRGTSWRGHSWFFCTSRSAISFSLPAPAVVVQDAASDWRSRAHRTSFPRKLPEASRRMGDWFHLVVWVKNQTNVLRFEAFGICGALHGIHKKPQCHCNSVKNGSLPSAVRCDKDREPVVKAHIELVEAIDNS